MKKHYFTLITLCLPFALLMGQTILFEEDFNDCTIPGNWEITLNGNQDAIWEVNTPNNTNSDGSSIDGSCMLIFDDDATGNGTDPWNIQLETPNFNTIGWSTVLLSMDIHFRNYDGSATLNVSVFDGENYQFIRSFQGAEGNTGEQFSEFVTVTADLSFYANENMSIVIEYDDGGNWAWWAGIDNIQVIGEGTATPILLEDFNDCEFPDAWSTQIISGENAWQIGYNDNPNAGEVSSMNGSCFAFFDDDALTADAAFSRAVLVSPPFSGLDYANYYLDFDLIVRRFTDQEHFAVGVFDETTQQIAWVNSYFEDVGGPIFNDFEHQSLDISALRRPSMRLVFLYDDGSNWGWWVGIDNIKITAEGAASDLCSNATPIEIDQACSIDNIENTLFTGIETACAGANVGCLWYQFTPTANQLVQVTTNAQYNDLVTVFQGDCDNLNVVNCSNYDEFGFTGEQEIVEVQAGQTYFVRVSGIDADFGIARGNHCLALTSINTYPEQPENDFCENATLLEVGNTCVSGNNLNASFIGPVPSRNDKSKADVWYRFVATQTNLEIITNADFADVITVFEGECQSLTEIACADLGRSLELQDLNIGQGYWIQVSGYFATIEGNLCIQVEAALSDMASNVDCVSALPLTLNDECTSLNNQGLTFTGLDSECAIYQGASVWFSVEAPTSGKIQILAEAEFVHTISLFSGSCDNMEEIFCMNSTRSCGDNPIINGLVPGETYWIRLSSSADLVGVLETGDLCIQVIDAEGLEESIPLSLFESLECYDNGRAQLTYQISGGSGNYEILGNLNGEIIENSNTYFVLVRDENGCETSITGTIDCQDNCSIFVDAIAAGENECPSDLTGSIEVSVEGGIAPYTYLWSDGSTSSSISSLPSGYYTVTVMDSEGLCAAVAGGVILGPAPYEFEIISVTNAGEDLNDGAIEIDFSGGATPYVFEWNRNGTVVSNDQNPNGLAPGTYDLFITDANGCTFNYENIVVEGPTSNNDLVLNSSVNLYPNPTIDRAYLDWNMEQMAIQSISIHTATGQQIRLLDLDENTITPYPIDLKNLSSGVYMINCFTDKGSFSRRLVKITE